MIRFKTGKGVAKGGGKGAGGKGGAGPPAPAAGKGGGGKGGAGPPAPAAGKGGGKGPPAPGTRGTIFPSLLSLMLVTGGPPAPTDERTLRNSSIGRNMSDMPGTCSRCIQL